MGDAWASVDTSINDTSINFEAPPEAPVQPTMNRRTNIPKPVPSTSVGSAGPSSPYETPGMDAGFLNNGFASIMANNARGAISGKINQFSPGFNWIWGQLTERFDVSNLYVRTKLRLLLFPKQRSWKRITEAEATGGADMNEENNHLAPPVFDHNAPDMYIPIMAFCTYILIAELWHGINGKFDPEHIQQLIYTGSLTVFLEAAIFYGIFYRFGIFNYAAQFFDMLCLCMYKFFGLCLIVAFETASNGNKSVFYSILTYAATCFALFLYQSLAANIADDGGATATKKTIVLGVTILEIVIMWWLSLV